MFMTSPSSAPDLQDSRRLCMVRPKDSTPSRSIRSYRAGKPEAAHELRTISGSLLVSRGRSWHPVRRHGLLYSEFEWLGLPPSTGSPERKRTSLSWPFEMGRKSLRKLLFLRQVQRTARS